MNHTHLTPTPTRPSEPETSIEVRGWASDNLTTGDVPAVIVCPEASARDLLSWGLGQLQQCNALLDALSNAQEDGNTNKVLQALLHFSQQAQTVLEAGVDRLR